MSDDRDEFYRQQNQAKIDASYNNYNSYYGEGSAYRQEYERIKFWDNWNKITYDNDTEENKNIAQPSTSNEPFRGIDIHNMSTHDKFCVGLAGLIAAGFAGYVGYGAYTDARDKAAYEENLIKINQEVEIIKRSNIYISLKKQFKDDKKASIAYIQTNLTNISQYNTVIKKSDRNYIRVTYRAPIDGIYGKKTQNTLTSICSHNTSCNFYFYQSTTKRKYYDPVLEARFIQLTESFVRSLDTMYCGSKVKMNTSFCATRPAYIKEMRKDNSTPS